MSLDVPLADDHLDTAVRAVGLVLSVLFLLGVVASPAVAASDGDEIGVTAGEQLYEGNETVTIWVGAVNTSAAPSRGIANSEIRVTVTHEATATGITEQNVTTNSSGVATLDIDLSSQPDGAYTITAEGAPGEDYAEFTAGNVTDGVNWPNPTFTGAETNLTVYARNGPEPVASVSDTITIEQPDGSTTTTSVTTDGDGFGSVSLTPTTAGEYIFRENGTFLGSVDAAPYVAQIVPEYDVRDQPAGATVELGGYLYDSAGLVQDQNFTVEIADENGNTVATIDTATNGAGLFSFQWAAPDSTQRYDLSARTAAGETVLVQSDYLELTELDSSTSTGGDVTLDARLTSGSGIVAPGNSVTLSVEASDDGTAITNQDVTASLVFDDAGIVFEQVTVTTDSQGRATVNVSVPSGAPGGERVSAEAAMSYSGKQYTDTGYGVDIQEFTVTISPSDGFAAGERNSLSVTATDEGGNPVADVPVAVATQYGQLFDVVATGTVRTNTSGEASLTVDLPADIGSLPSFEEPRVYLNQISRYEPANFFTTERLSNRDNGDATLSLDRTEIAPGETLTVEFEAGGSNPSGLVALYTEGGHARYVTGPPNTSLALSLPESAVTGSYELVVMAVDDSGTVYTARRDVSVVEPVAPTSDWPKFRGIDAQTGVNVGSGPESGVFEQWRYEATAGFESSPAVVDGTVYVGNGDGGIYALNASTGDVEWSALGGSTAAIESSPAVADGRVYVGKNDGSIYALNATDGSTIWSEATGDQVRSSPTVVADTVYVGSDDGIVYALNATDGTLQWSYTAGGLISYSSPAVTEETVYIGSSDRNVYAINATDGTERWSYETGGVVTSSPAVADGIVYIGSGDGNVSALDAGTGALEWNYTTGAPVGSSPAVADGTVYVGSDDATVYALDATDGTEQWSYITDSGIGRSSPAVVDGVVYVGTSGSTLLGLDAADGTQLWSFFADGGGLTSPAVVNDTVYVGEATSPYGFYALGALGTLNGTVTDAETGDPLDGTTVIVSNYNTITDVTTDGNGEYSLDLPPGEYTIEVRSSTHADTFAEATVRGDRTTTRDIALDPGGTVTGTVTNATTGDTVTNAYVMLDGSSHNDSLNRYFTQTNATGEYTEQVSAGNYTVTTFETTTTVANQSHDLSVTTGETTIQDLELIAPAIGNQSVAYLGGSGTPDLANVSVTTEFQYGRLWVGLANDTASTSTALATPSELQGLGVAPDDRFEINLTVDGFEPGTLQWGATNATWARTATNGTYNVTIRTEPVHIEAIQDSTLTIGTTRGESAARTNWPTGAADVADLDWNRTVAVMFEDLSTLRSDRREQLDGLVTATNAQTVSRLGLLENVTDNGTTFDALGTYVGAPKTTVTGQPHQGFYDVFIPDPLLAEWNVDDPDAELTAVYRADSHPFTVTETDTGVWVELDIGYSDGVVAVAAFREPNFTVAIDGTNSPVEAGDTLTADATVDNVGTTSGTQNVTLSVAGTQVDSQSVDLGVNENRTVTLQYATTGDDLGTQNVTVASNDDSDSATITVEEESTTTTTTQPQPSPDIDLGATALEFGDVPVGESVSESVIVSNVGDATLEVSALTIDGFDAGAYAVETEPFSLAPGDSRSVTVVLEPTESGSASADLDVASNDPDESTVSVDLDGTGVETDLTVNETAVSFGGVGIESTATRRVRFRNNGSTPITITSLSVTGGDTSEFGIDGGTIDLAPEETAVVGLTFTPDAVGPSTATATVAFEGATESRFQLSLNGTGLGPEIAVEPDQLAFDSIPVAGNTTRTLTVRNGGAAELVVNDFAVAGESRRSFRTVTDSLRVPPGDNGTVDVRFRPVAVGDASATLSVGSNDPERTPTVALSGTATTANVSVSPLTVDFGATRVGTTATESVTITNDGSRPVVLGNTSRQGRQFAVANGSTVPLTPGDSRTLNVSYQPRQAGTHNGTMRVRTNDTTLPTLTIGLGGVATAPEVGIRPSSVNFGEVALNETVTEEVTITNTGAAPLNVSDSGFSGTGRDVFTLRDGTPFTVPADENRSVTVAFTPDRARTFSGTLTLSTNDPDEPTVPVWVSNANTTVDIDLKAENGTQRMNASIEEVEPGEQITVNTSAGPSEQGASVQTVSVTPETDEEFSLNMSSQAEPDAQTPEFNSTNGTEPLNYINVTHSIPNEQIQNASMSVRVDKDRLDALETTDPEDISLYRFVDGEYREQPTELERETASSLFYSVRAEGFSDWTTGAKRAQFEVIQAEVSLSTITTGDSVNINVRISNTGGADGEFLTELLLEGEVVDTRTVEIAAGGASQVTFGRSFDQPGEYSLQVNDFPVGQVTVQPPNEVSIGTAEPGEASGESNSGEGSDGDTGDTDSGDSGDGGLPVVPLAGLAVVVLLVIGVLATRGDE